MQSEAPATDDDIWLRAVTNANHVRKNGVYRGQLKHWLAPPDDIQKPWKLELSGRLLSIIRSISQDAERRVSLQRDKLAQQGKSVPSDIKYCGIVHAKVGDIRGSSLCRFDVVPDQQPDDDAHANIIVIDKGADEILTVVEVLLEVLIWLSKDEVATHAAFSSKA